jgi:hypothetical protein
MYTAPNQRLSIESECDEFMSTQSKSNMTTTLAGQRAKSPECSHHQCSNEDTDETASMSSVSSEAFGAEIDLAEEAGRFKGNNTEANSPTNCDDDVAGKGASSRRDNVATMKGVRFSTLTIREYEIRLGDNVTSAGAPVTIAWDHVSEAIYSVEEYDNAVEKTRRTKSQLQMPVTHREELLHGHGYSRKEIREAAKQAAKARNRRRMTNQRMPLLQVDEFFENSRRAGAWLVAPMISRGPSLKKLPF